jgi:hypothetical protein
VRHDGAVDVEGAVEVDIDYAAPFGGVVFVERRVLAGDARRMDEDIDTAMGLRGPCGCRAGGIAIGDIDLQRRCGVAELLPGGGEYVGIDVPEADASALSHETGRDGEAYALSSTGDDGDLVLQFIIDHGIVFSSSVMPSIP